MNCHNNHITCLAMNYSGSIYATASEKGTLIRIYESKSHNKLQELRRGSNKAVINNLAFDRHSRWLACSSDHGTIHIFALDEGITKMCRDEEDNTITYENVMSDTSTVVDTP